MQHINGVIKCQDMTGEAPRGEVCRFCGLNDENEVKISLNESLLLRLNRLGVKLASKDALLPNKVCLTCEEKAKSSCAFLEKCRKVENSLRKRNHRSSTSKVIEEIVIDGPAGAEAIPNGDGGGLEDANNKRVRKILPKSSTSPQQQQQQIMIPVTIKTPCKKCGETIRASSYPELQRHKCHPAENEFPCDKCDKKFRAKSTLRYHVRVEHTNALRKQRHSVTTTSAKRSSVSGGRFVCKFDGCDKSYASKNYLVEHERVHTGEKPFQCPNCQRRFYRILDQKKHRLLKVCEWA